MKNLRQAKLLFISLLFQSFIYAQSELEPGVDRWTIKTSAQNFTSNTSAKAVSLNKLLLLPLLEKKYSANAYADKLIPKKIGTLKEGDIISTTGYLHLVALEDAPANHRDGDYHIQLTLHPQWSDSCFIVEIPFEDFAASDLKSLCGKNRSFIRKKLLHSDSKEPSKGGSVMQSEVYVKVTGQLFYDAIHATQMGNPDPAKRKYRGKRGNGPSPMHSYTAWEIHPVTNIEFAPKPTH